MDKYSFAPYNFIPFSDVKTPVPYASKEMLPKHGKIEEGSLSGRIRFSVKALSEIAVGGVRNEQNEKDQKNKQNINEFCKDLNENYVIQGSTMRGFIRSHAEMLSFANPEYITSETFLYRKLAGNCKTARDQYSAELKASQERGLRLPDGVKAGWIFKDGTSYYIQPVREFGTTGTTFFQIHERDLRRANVLTSDQYMYLGMIPKFYPKNPENLDYELKSYNRNLKDKKNSHYKSYRGNSVGFDYEDGRILNIGRKDAKFKGTILNSAWMNGKTHHYLVSEKDMGSPFIIPKDRIAEYISDYERNCIQNRSLRDNAEFYALPDKKRKMFFYKRGADNTLIGFGPTPYFRIFYKQSAREGIPGNHQDSGYDYVQGMFGYVDSDEAYKSRISFSDAVCEDSEKKLNDRPVVLIGPRGTAIQMYLEQKGRISKTLNTYNTKGFRLRGYKFYWKRSDVKTDNNENGKIVTQLKTLPAGSVFHGEIRFNNLSKDELGLLLLSIRYTDNAEQHESFMIGGGKPYGFGHIEIKDVSLSLMDQATRYTSLNVAWNDDVSKEIPGLKKEYKETLLKKYGIELEKQETVSIYLAYAGLKNADAYLDSSETIYMPVSRNARDMNLGPVYSDFHPLGEARDIFTQLGTKVPSYTQTGGMKNHAAGDTAVDVKSARKSGAVWIAGYPLSDAQKKRLKDEKVQVLDSIRSWATGDLLKGYAEKYDTVLLPARNSPDIEALAKKLFARVYCAKKSGKVDDGWKVLKI